VIVPPRPSCGIAFARNRPSPPQNRDDRRPASHTDLEGGKPTLNCWSDRFAWSASALAGRSATRSSWCLAAGIDQVSADPSPTTLPAWRFLPACRPPILNDAEIVTLRRCHDHRRMILGSRSKWMGGHRVRIAHERRRRLH